MDPEETEAGNDCAGEDEQQFYPPTDQSAGSLWLVSSETDVSSVTSEC
jgi:hypothetical protein